MMRDFLKELGFKFEDSELDPIIQMLAGAHQQRVQSEDVTVGEVRRATAIVALADLAPEISRQLEAAGLDWQGFRESVGLSDNIIPAEVRDVELHENFKTALTRFAETHTNWLRPMPAVLAWAIVRMVAWDPKIGMLGMTFMTFGANITSLEDEIIKAVAALGATPKGTVDIPPPPPEDNKAAEDPLVDRLLQRRLAVSTMASNDITGALSLIDGPKSWGLGPEIEPGDIVIVYFPKTLAKNKGLKDRGPQKSGLRFLLRAAAASTKADREDNFRQLVEISARLELSRPVEPSEFTVGPVAEWSLPKQRFRRAGQKKEPLPADLARALWILILETNPELRPELETWVTEEPSPPAEVSTHATSDLWTVDDKLGYAEYARAIYHFLTDPRTEPPLTISIQAPWGGGKTSLMRMVQQQLDPEGYDLWSGTDGRSLTDTLKATTRDLLDELSNLTKQTPTEITLNLGPGKCASIWFNAWRYQSMDQIWAGLAEAIIRGITDRLEPVDREKFLLRLHLSRVNPDLVRARVHDAVFRRFVDTVRRFGLWALVGLLVLAGVLSEQTVPIVGGPASLSALVLGIFAAASAYLKARIQAGKEPAKLNLSDYVEVPDYSEKLGFVHHVTEDLRRVFGLLPTIERDGKKRRVPLVIFIDDLDRCAPSKVAEVFEAINMFVAGEFPNCYIVIGMDTEVVAAALEEAHKNVIARLPSYARRVPVGWRFMDKFVQLPFVIPPLDDQAVADYADHLAAAEDREAREVQARASGDGARDAEANIQEMLDRGEDEEVIIEQTAKFFVVGEPDPMTKAAFVGGLLAKQQLESVKRQRYIDEQALNFQGDSDKVQWLLRDAREDFSNNPRELKRLVNVYRFYYNLSLARLSRDQPVPTEPQLENWLKFSLLWPEVVRWLRRGFSESQSDLDSAASTKTDIGRRLAKLEELATTQVEYRDDSDSGAAKMRDPTIRDWAKSLHAEFGLPEDVPWLADERLLRFLRKTASDGEEGRLSDGAGQGFW